MSIGRDQARHLPARRVQPDGGADEAGQTIVRRELRTLMNAIKGFTNLVLGRRSENLNDQ